LVVLVLTACNGGKASTTGDQNGDDGGQTPVEDAGFGGSDGGLVDSGALVDAGADAGKWEDGGTYEPPCDFTITPTSVNWNEVQPGTFDDGGVLGIFTISDIGPGSCTLGNITLCPGSDPAFSLVGGPVVSVQLSPPGVDAGFPSDVQLSVSFTPRGPGSYSGAICFGISDPSAPHEEIPFSITIGGGNSCLIFEPPNLGFGTVGFGPCAPGYKRTFEAVNGCAQPVTLQSMTLVDAGAFTLSGGDLPEVIPQGQVSSPFTVTFPGGEAGNYEATILIQTDLISAPFTVTLQAVVAQGAPQTDTFTFSGNYLFLLTGIPDRDGPSVTVNGTVLWEGLDWSFDLISNIVAIDSTWRTLNDGDQVEISYHLACG
jgi:hypothetical protein